MTQLTGPWRKFFRAITALLTISFLSASPSCSVESEQAVCEAELNRTGVGCEGLVAFSAVLGDTRSLTPEQEGAYNIALAMCLSWLAKKAECDGKSSTKPDILF